jgi:hypothetical protein
VQRLDHDFVGSRSDDVMIAWNHENYIHLGAAAATKFSKPLGREYVLVLVAGESDVAGHNDYRRRPETVTKIFHVSQQLIPEVKVWILRGLDFGFTKVDVGQMDDQHDTSEYSVNGSARLLERQSHRLQ